MIGHVRSLGVSSRFTYWGLPLRLARWLKPPMPCVPLGDDGGLFTGLVPLIEPAPPRQGGMAPRPALPLLRRSMARGGQEGLSEHLQMRQNGWHM